MLRIGLGYDTHKLIKYSSKKPLMLGGILIPNRREFSLEAHSDGDVLLHSLTDAMLGALALGDIGKHFSNKKKDFQNKNSSYFLKFVQGMISDKQYKVANIDSTIVADKPIISPYVDTIRSNISKMVNINVDQVSVKCKTSEGMNPNIISCYALATLIHIIG